MLACVGTILGYPVMHTSHQYQCGAIPTFGIGKLKTLKRGDGIRERERERRWGAHTKSWDNAACSADYRRIHDSLRILSPVYSPRCLILNPARPVARPSAHPCSFAPAYLRLVRRCGRTPPARIQSVCSMFH